MLLGCGWRNEGGREGGSVLGGRAGTGGGGGRREREGVVIGMGGHL